MLNNEFSIKIMLKCTLIEKIILYKQLRFSTLNQIYQVAIILVQSFYETTHLLKKRYYFLL